MTGSIASQLGLLACFEAWERAERVAALLPDVLCANDLRFLQDEADRRFLGLMRAAIQCGYAPGREDRFETCADWSRQRAEAIRKTFRAHVREAGL